MPPPWSVDTSSMFVPESIDVAPASGEDGACMTGVSSAGGGNHGPPCGGANATAEPIGGFCDGS